MPIKPEISIIIPVFNRETLLAYTLDSIISQTFKNWECILVDDQSTDGSFAVMNHYKEKDKRFKAYLRPLTLKKGANACRNYGFSKSEGKHIKWFDSDDIMLPSHLDMAYKKLTENKLDFVVTDTVNFSHETGELLNKPYLFNRSNAVISARNFALVQIGWITDDFLGNREIVKNLRFNENITTDGDEYNFFVRLLNQRVKGMLLEKILTHRRVHEDSLTNINSENSTIYLFKMATIKYQTANDLVEYNNNLLIRWFLSGYMQYAFKLALNKKSIPNRYSGFRLICRYYSVYKGVAFFVALLIAKYFKKGYNIMKYARKQ